MKGAKRIKHPPQTLRGYIAQEFRDWKRERRIKKAMKQGWIK